MSIRLGELIIAGAGQTRFTSQPATGEDDVIIIDKGVVRNTAGAFFWNVSGVNQTVTSTTVITDGSIWSEIAEGGGDGSGTTITSDGDDITQLNDSNEIQVDVAAGGIAEIDLRTTNKAAPNNEIIGIGVDNDNNQLTNIAQDINLRNFDTFGGANIFPNEVLHLVDLGRAFIRNVGTPSVAIGGVALSTEAFTLRSIAQNPTLWTELTLTQAHSLAQGERLPGDTGTGEIITDNGDGTFTENRTNIPRTLTQVTSTGSQPGDTWLLIDDDLPTVIDENTFPYGIWILTDTPGGLFVWVFTGTLTQWNRNIAYVPNQIVQLIVGDESTTFEAHARTGDTLPDNTFNFGIEPGVTVGWEDLWTRINSYTNAARIRVVNTLPGGIATQTSTPSYDDGRVVQDNDIVILSIPVADVLTTIVDKDTIPPGLYRFRILSPTQQTWIQSDRGLQWNSNLIYLQGEVVFNSVGGANAVETPFRAITTVGVNTEPGVHADTDTFWQRLNPYVGELLEEVEDAIRVAQVGGREQIDLFNEPASGNNATPTSWRLTLNEDEQDEANIATLPNVINATNNFNNNFSVANDIVDDSNVFGAGVDVLRLDVNGSSIFAFVANRHIELSGLQFVSGGMLLPFAAGVDFTITGTVEGQSLGRITDLPGGEEGFRIAIPTSELPAGFPTGSPGDEGAINYTREQLQLRHSKVNILDEEAYIENQRIATREYVDTEVAGISTSGVIDAVIVSSPVTTSIQIQAGGQFVFLGNLYQADKDQGILTITSSSTAESLLASSAIGPLGGTGSGTTFIPADNAMEIKTAYESNADTNAFTDGDEVIVDGWNTPPTGVKPNDVSWKELTHTLIHDDVIGEISGGGELGADFMHPAATNSLTLLVTLASEDERDIAREQFFLPGTRAVGPTTGSFGDARVIDRVQNQGSNALLITFETGITVPVSDGLSSTLTVYTVEAEFISKIEGGTYTNGVLSIPAVEPGFSSDAEALFSRVDNFGTFQDPAVLAEPIFPYNTTTHIVLGGTAYYIHYRNILGSTAATLTTVADTATIIFTYNIN